LGIFCAKFTDDFEISEWLTDDNPSSGICCIVITWVEIGQDVIAFSLSLEYREILANFKVLQVLVMLFQAST